MQHLGKLLIPKHFINLSSLNRTTPSLSIRIQCFSSVEQTKAQSNEQVAISKEILIKMRKETGYSYANCRKALVKFGVQNYSDALKWIKEEAKKEGWEKAAKLGNRNATQGVCAFVSDRNLAAMVEVNCETDFVARNGEFKELVQKLTNGLFSHGMKMMENNKCSYDDSGKLNYSLVSAKEFGVEEGQTAEDAIVDTIGKLGENIVLNAAKIFFTHPSATIIGHTHPNEEFGNVQMGRFLSLIALKRHAANSGFPTLKLGQQICHHIIGMVPERLGEPPVSMQTEETNSTSSNVEQTEEGEESDDDGDSIELTRINENEQQLLRQPFMFNPQQTIHSYLSYHGADVMDFTRMGLGQSGDSD